MLPSPKEVEQKVPTVEEGFAEEGEMASVFDENSTRSFPEEADLRGGAAPKIQSLLDVSQSSVIDSSNATLVPSKEVANPGTHESLFDPPSRLINNPKVNFV